MICMQWQRVDSWTRSEAQGRSEAQRAAWTAHYFFQGTARFLTFVLDVKDGSWKLGASLRPHVVWLRAGRRSFHITDACVQQAGWHA